MKPGPCCANDVIEVVEASIYGSEQCSSCVCYKYIYVILIITLDRNGILMESLISIVEQRNRI